MTQNDPKTFFDRSELDGDNFHDDPFCKIHDGTSIMLDSHLNKSLKLDDFHYLSQSQSASEIGYLKPGSP